jgi:uncharacterized protein YndB with AHSA1/START domain
MSGDRNLWVASGGTPAQREGEPVRKEADVAAPPSRVWRALTEAGELSAWFGAEAEIDPRPGGHLSLRFDDDWVRPGVVEDCVPERRLSFRWLPFERHPDGSWRPMGPGRVEFELEATETGTRLTVSEWGGTTDAPGVAAWSWAREEGGR